MALETSDAVLPGYYFEPDFRREFPVRLSLRATEVAGAPQCELAPNDGPV